MVCFVREWEIIFLICLSFWSAFHSPHTLSSTQNVWNSWNVQATSDVSSLLHFCTSFFANVFLCSLVTKIFHLCTLPSFICFFHRFSNLMSHPRVCAFTPLMFAIRLMLMLQKHLLWMTALQRGNNKKKIKIPVIEAIKRKWQKVSVFLKGYFPAVT